jgi:hypothetical protein
MDEFLRSAMSRDISEIPGLSGKTLVLFRAAGFVTVGSLVGKSTPEVVRALTSTNGEYGVVGWLPSPDAVKAWIATARLLEEAGPMSEEASAEVRESAILVARPVLGSELMSAGVRLESIPIAKFVGDALKSRSAVSSVTQIRMDARKRRRKRSDRVEGAEGATDSPADLEGEESNTEFPADLEGAESKADFPADLEGAEAGLPYEEAIVPERRERSYFAEEVTPRVRTPDEEAGPLQFRDTESLVVQRESTERRNHGMTHKDPGRARMSAAVTVVTLAVAWIAGLTGIGLAVYFALAIGQMPKWLLGFPSIVPVCLLLYGTLGLRARCRLCGYGLFAHKSCSKHEKAHHSIFGSVFATALRVLFHGSWRCMYCGTKQKLK